MRGKYSMCLCLPYSMTHIWKLLLSYSTFLWVQEEELWVRSATFFDQEWIIIADILSTQPGADHCGKDKKRWNSQTLTYKKR